MDEANPNLPRPQEHEAGTVVQGDGSSSHNSNKVGARLRRLTGLEQTEGMVPAGKPGVPFGTRTPEARGYRPAIR